MAETPELQRLVEQGRKLALAAESAGARRDRERAEERAAADERLLAKLGSVSFFTRGGWILGALLACVPWGYAVAPLVPAPWFHGGVDGDFGHFVVALSMLVPLLGAFALRRPVGAWAWGREEAWARSLPFSLPGYPSALERPPGSCTIRLRLIFAGAAPERSILDAVARTFAGKLEADGRTLTSAFDFDDSEHSVGTNAFVRAEVRAAVKRLLVLHGSYPIATVSVQVF